MRNVNDKKNFQNIALNLSFFPLVFRASSIKKFCRTPIFLKNSDILNLLNPCNINEKAIFENMSLGKRPLVLPFGSTAFFP